MIPPIHIIILICIAIILGVIGSYVEFRKHNKLGRQLIVSAIGIIGLCGALLHGFGIKGIVAIVLCGILGFAYMRQEQIRSKVNKNTLTRVLALTGFLVTFSLLMRLITKPDAAWLDIAGHSLFNGLFFGAFFYFMTRKDKSGNK